MQIDIEVTTACRCWLAPRGNGSSIALKSWVCQRLSAIREVPFLYRQFMSVPRALTGETRGHLGADQFGPPWRVFAASNGRLPHECLIGGVAMVGFTVNTLWLLRTSMHDLEADWLARPSMFKRLHL
jgi:hypothetical protein